MRILRKIKHTLEEIAFNLAKKHFKERIIREKEEEIFLKQLKQPFSPSQNYKYLTDFKEDRIYYKNLTPFYSLVYITHNETFMENLNENTKLKAIGFLTIDEKEGKTFEYFNNTLDYGVVNAVKAVFEK